VRQLVFSPRWMLWHVLTLGAMATCGWLAAWQWHRAGSAMGSALNVGYGLQWPVFAVFFGVMWWRMLRMEAAKLEEGEADVSVEVTAPVGGGIAPVVAGQARSAGPRPAEPRPRAASDGPSPFGPRPASVLPRVAAEDDPELAEYNQMLAHLAARDSTD
jgi:DNA-binding transcriptional regulator of glucitol operon